MKIELSKALIVAQPWVGYILDGVKTWEMRSQKTTIRGWIALVEKGSGTVTGVARLVDSLEPLSKDEMLDSIGKHQIPARMIESGEVDPWRFPWVLADVQRLHRPVSYRHPPGAVTWVNLEDGVRQEIADQMARVGSIFASSDTLEPIRSPKRIVRAVDTLAAPPDMTRPSAALKAFIPEAVNSTAAYSTGAAGQVIGESRLSAGNINNHHFYLTSYLNRFPPDVIGGRNSGERARRSVEIDWGDSEPAVTDIDGSKNIFRARAWIRAFFEKNRVTAGETVQVLETAPYRYSLRIKGR